MDLRSLIGLTEQEARAEVAKWGMIVIIARRDNDRLTHTLEHGWDKVKLGLVNGKVTGAWIEID